jgi:hypothetical protein
MVRNLVREQPRYLDVLLPDVEVDPDDRQTLGEDLVLAVGGATGRRFPQEARHGLPDGRAHRGDDLGLAVGLGDVVDRLVDPRADLLGTLLQVGVSVDLLAQHGLDRHQLVGDAGVLQLFGHLRGK